MHAKVGMRERRPCALRNFSAIHGLRGFAQSYVDVHFLSAANYCDARDIAGLLVIQNYVEIEFARDVLAVNRHN